eukprot:12352729-Alexandrium_andersonii.AAC.1
MQFSAVSALFCTPPRGRAPEALFGVVRGAVTPPGRSAEKHRNPQKTAFCSFLQLSALLH